MKNTRGYPVFKHARLSYLLSMLFFLCLLYCLPFTSFASTHPGEILQGPQALFTQGRKSFFGLQGPVDQTQGAQLILRAAEAGYPVAMVAISGILRAGVGVQRDISAAELWLRRAEGHIDAIERLATNGNSEAQIALASLYEGVFSHHRQIELGMQWFRTAADSAYLPAIYEYASALLQHRDRHADNSGQGLLLLQQCAEQGLAICQAGMAQLYQYGNLVSQNISEAIHSAELASQQGLGAAEFILARIYSREPHYRDNQKAKYWYRRALAKNVMSGRAAYELGMIFYEEGYHKEAFELHQLALQRGSNTALITLAEYYLQGRIVRQDYRQALEYLDASASLNNYRAFEIYADLYFNGEVVERDVEKSVVYYQKAIQAGSPTALAAYMRTYWYWQWDLNRDGGVDADDYIAIVERLVSLPGDALIYQLSKDRMHALTLDIGFSSYQSTPVWVFSSIVWLLLIVIARSLVRVSRRLRSRP